MKIKLHLIFVIGVLFFSCTKKNSEVISRLELLTRQDWIIQKAEEKTDNGPWTDSFPFWPACEKDDKWKFKIDMSLELNDAAMPCGTNTPNQVLDVLTWRFDSNETKIVIDGDVFDIMQLSDPLLILYAAETIGGSTYYSKLTLSH